MRQTVNQVEISCRYRVSAPCLRDWAGNICINPNDRWGHMYVRETLVHVDYKDISTNEKSKS